MMDRYPEFELTVLRIEDAFDPKWWSGQRPSENAESTDGLVLSMLSLCNYSRLCSLWWKRVFPLTRSSLMAAISHDVASLASSPSDRLRAYLQVLPTSTAVHHAIDNLTRQLLQHTARSTGSSHILLGSSLTSLSVALISGISQGSGFAVKEERDETWEGIRIARPLRDIGVKECAAWLWWRGLKVLPRNAADLLTAKEAATIQRLTRGKQAPC